MIQRLLMEGLGTHFCSIVDGWSGAPITFDCIDDKLTVTRRGVSVIATDTFGDDKTVYYEAVEFINIATSRIAEWPNLTKRA